MVEQIAIAGGEARLNDLATRLSLNKSTLHGLLNTLVALGYVNRHGLKYTLGLRLRSVSLSLADVEARIHARFYPALKRFAEIAQENSYLIVPGGVRGGVCICAVDADGASLPAYSGTDEWGLTTSAAGRVLLAHDLSLMRSLRKANKIAQSLEADLRSIAMKGFALDLGSEGASNHSLAIPLHGPDGQVVAALTMVAASKALDEVALVELAQRLKLDAQRTGWRGDSTIHA